jgi:hypothetical protein
VADGGPTQDQRAAGWLTAVKGLTLTNAAVIILLVVGLGPAYLIYKIVNDEKLMDRVMSEYQEVSSEMTPCALRMVHARGAPETWYMSTGFAYQGSDRWMVAVAMDHKPNHEEIASYCATLGLIVDFMRDPDAESPTFPNNSGEPVVRQYQRNRGD